MDSELLDPIPKPPDADMVRCACGCQQDVATEAPGKDDLAPIYIGEFGKRQRRRAVFVDDTHQALYFATRPAEGTK